MMMVVAVAWQGRVLGALLASRGRIGFFGELCVGQTHTAHCFDWRADTYTRVPATYKRKTCISVFAF
jgi:hypothetical protein